MVKTKTLSAGKARYPFSRDEGYTLIELLVVLSIIAVLVSLSSEFSLHRNAINNPYFQGELIEASCQKARVTAMTEGRAVDVYFNSEHGSWRVEKESETPLPTDMRLIAKTASFSADLANEARIRFFPDGSSTGGQIRLTHEGKAASVKVDWLTGRIGVQHDG